MGLAKGKIFFKPLRCIVESVMQGQEVWWEMPKWNERDGKSLTENRTKEKRMFRFEKKQEEMSVLKLQLNRLR